jgi:hypothetical protein
MIYFIHPRSGKKVEVKAPLFSDMQKFLKNNFKKEVVDESFRITEYFKDIDNNFITI